MDIARVEAALPEFLRRVALLGTAGYSPRTARRLAVINVTTLIAAAVTVVYFIFYGVYDAAGLWLLMAVCAAQTTLFLSVPWFHRFGPLAAAGFFVSVWLVCMTVLAVLLGRDSGIHFYFLPGAAGLLLFLGVTRIGLAAAITPIPIGLFLFSEFFLTQPSRLVAADPTLLRIGYLMNMPGAYLLIFTMVFYALHQTRRAEDALEAEHARSERLLANLLPASIAERLKSAPEKIIADDLGQVTILFADIVDFTPRAAALPAPQLVAFLNRVFTEFDKLAEKHGLEKIKTIGDAYMVAAGMPDPRADHAQAVAEMALDMLEATRRISAETGEDVAVRIGLHTGPAVAGVIGTRKFFYDVWGDTVNTAARMESHGEPGRIQVTDAARRALDGAYRFEPRGEIEVKGKGRMPTWWLMEKSPAAEPEDRHAA